MGDFGLESVFTDMRVKCLTVLLAVLAIGGGCLVLEPRPRLNSDAGADGATDPPDQCSSTLTTPALLVANYDGDPSRLEDADFLCRQSQSWAGRTCLRPLANQLGLCAEHTFCEGGEDRGARLCTTLSDDPEIVFGGVGESLEVRWDVPTLAPNETPKFFSGWVERLGGSQGNACGTPSAPLNLITQKLDTLTFWVRTTPGVDLEFALKSSGEDSNGIEGVQSLNLRTGIKPKLTEYLSPESVQCDGWRKVSVPIRELLSANVISSGQRFTCIDPARILEVNWAFTDLMTQLQGVLQIDNVGFDRSPGFTYRNLDCIAPPPVNHLLIADYEVSPAETASDAGPAPPPLAPVFETTQCLRGSLANRTCEKPRPNSLRQCSESVRCDQRAGTESGSVGGGLCVSYETDPGLTLDGTGTSLRLDFDVSAPPVAGASAFATYSESLAGSGDRCAPVASPRNISGQMPDGVLSFWVLTEPRDVDLRLTLRSENGAETTPRLPLSRYRNAESYCGTWQDWRKICVPLRELVRNEAGPGVDLARLLDVRFTFEPGAHNTGTVWLDRVMFEEP